MHYNTPGLDDYAWQLSITLVKAAPALFILLLCGYIATRIWERIRYAHADTYGRLPIPRYALDDPTLAKEALAASHSVELARATHQVPERLTVSYAPKLSNTTTPAPAAIEAQAAPVIDVPTFSTLIDKGLIGQGQPLILGYTERSMLTGSWRDLYSSAVAGINSSGKTTTIRFLASQAALCGARFAILDPHADTGEESLAATLEPLQAALLCETASQEHDMLQAVRFLQTRLDARLGGERDRTPLILAVDEFTRLMRSPQVAAPLAALLESVATEGRKVGIFCMLSGQSWTADRAGGTPLRDSLASCYVHRPRRTQARLLLSTEDARRAETLKPGRALLLRTNGDLQSVSVPLTTGFDVERVNTLLEPSTNPARNQLETTSHHEPLSAEAARIVELFRQGSDTAAIVRTIDPEARTGARYQKRSAEVQAVLREVL